MKKVIIASTNPVKIKVAEKAFADVFPNEKFEFVSVKSESGVPEQPMNEETLQGARNRLSFVRNKHPQADYWISQEGGLFTKDKRLFCRAWIVICDKDGFIGEASTSNFYLPPKVKEYIEQGMDLGKANDTFFAAVNSAQGIGAIGHLTDGLVDRVEYYVQPAIIALSEVKHKDWY